ncbi:alpha/beta fold hydrolase [Hyalangium rubrum]|uniref:Alpha/beta fold hydrolase n=1 Tax=Hyalangium rubrum TaxID=3103134 RepID=A0ABU5GYS7_9BACT|nr:alpha/beta fold hydrolase [Hyalangium sp. s54d21]MDY7226211.1 alpha/beta fold hydrolase [Hyalangium sp. s54d21]
MAKNSTNVRKKMARLALRLTGRTLGTLAPEWAAQWGERLFCTPQRTAPSRTARAVLAQGQQRFLELCGERVAVWSWGEGPRVLLVHGWSGYGGQLTAFVAPLVAAGFSVVTFDAPGHGLSSGSRSSLPELARVIRAVAHATGGPHALVAHSIGAAASALALHQGLEVERAVLLSPPSDPRKAVAFFSREVALPGHAVKRMVARLEARLGRLEDYVVPRFAPALKTPVRIFHDVGDEEVRVESGEAIAQAWPGARLVRTQGLGHYRILYTPAVVSEAVAFITESRPRDAWPLVTAPLAEAAATPSLRSA